MNRHRLTFSALVSGALLVGSAVSVVAQTASPATAPAEILNFDALAEQGKVLLEKADGGNASITLSSYQGYHTMLTVRRKSGGGELHKNYADFMFVVADEGTELVGGMMRAHSGTYQVLRIYHLPS